MSAGATCSSCSRPILWVIVDKTGKTMPLDREPVEGGNIKLTGRTRATRSGRAAPEVAYETPSLLPPDGERYVSHFATCPNAQRHRKG